MVQGIGQERLAVGQASGELRALNVDGRGAGLRKSGRTLGRMATEVAPREWELFLASLDWKSQADCWKEDLKAGELRDKAVQLRMVVAGDQLAAVVTVVVAGCKAPLLCVEGVVRVVQVWTGQAETAILMDEPVGADVELTKGDEEAPKPPKSSH